MERAGISRTRPYHIWVQMKDRCYNPHCFCYDRYGGRGIVMCDEWKNSALAFYNWSMANGYADNLSIDRIDVNGNYCPENCRWATDMEQANNTRWNRYITYNGKTQTAAQWARELGLSPKLIYKRLRLGWDGVKAITEPIHSKRKAVI